MPKSYPHFYPHLLMFNQTMALNQATVLNQTTASAERVSCATVIHMLRMYARAPSLPAQMLCVQMLCVQE